MTEGSAAAAVTGATVVATELAAAAVAAAAGDTPVATERIGREQKWNHVCCALCYSSEI